jgi:hypothetical protein
MADNKPTSHHMNVCPLPFSLLMSTPKNPSDLLNPSSKHGLAERPSSTSLARKIIIATSLNGMHRYILDPHIRDFHVAHKYEQNNGLYANARLRCNEERRRPIWETISMALNYGLGLRIGTIVNRGCKRRTLYGKGKSEYRVGVSDEYGQVSNLGGHALVVAAVLWQAGV